MKRTPFKPRKTPLRASQGLRKASKQPISKLQRDLWAECKRITRLRYKDCYTCPAKNLQGANAHTGHGPWAKAAIGAYLKYDLRCLRLQCYACNVHRSGMSYEFGKKLLGEIGPEAMAQLEADRQKTVKAYDHYARLLDEYRKL
jgi:hypothetical protein